MIDLSGFGLIRDPGAYLMGLETPLGVFARREILREPIKGDAGLAREMARTIKAAQEKEGHWNGSLYETSFRLIELSYLRLKTTDRGVKTALEWITSRQGAEGADNKAFFAPTEADLARYARLYVGDRIPSDRSAVFLGSCIALRALLGAGAGSRAAPKRAMTELTRLVKKGKGFYCCGRCTPGAHQALAMSLTVRRSPLRKTMLAWYAANGQPNGIGWIGTPLFHALDAIGLLGGDEAKPLVEGVLPHLAQAQNLDGSWGGTFRPEKTLAVVRALTVLL
jgi:hypothetical protein